MERIFEDRRFDESLEKKKGVNLGIIEEGIKLTLEMLAERVLTDLKKDIRQKYEQLITDLVHQREVTRQLMNEKVTSVSEFVWLYHMRFYFNHKQKNALE
jgi:dynein heavy chain 1